MPLYSHTRTAVAQRTEQVTDYGHGSRVQIPPVVRTVSSLTVSRVGLLLCRYCALHFHYEYPIPSHHEDHARCAFEL